VSLAEATDGIDQIKTASALLQPGRNVWRCEKAARVAVLVDAAAYYGVLRQVLRNAKRSIYIIGWDIDSRTPLVGADGKTGDDLPPRLGPFLSELAARSPDLSIKLLLWDYAPLYSLEREKIPALTLQWSTPPQIELCLDKMLPIGASHHQKIVVVDDAVAFSGGLDLTIRRWDTAEHAPGNLLRVDPAGVMYPPFHDVQMMVDGPAARALGDLVRMRWQRVTQERLAPVDVPVDEVACEPDLWPETLQPHFRNTTIGIARTHPRYGAEVEIREIEHLFLDMIRSARRSIYIENQFLTCNIVAQALVDQLKARPDLEVVIVTPKTYYSWLEQQSMLSGRIRFMRCLRQAGVDHRVRLLYPHICRDGQEADVKVHSKVMIVDDRILRVGSANLCNRSVGLDTECDLAIEASNEQERDGVTLLRNSLLAEHCGATAQEVAEVLAQNQGSLFAVLDAFPNREHRLLPVEDRTMAGLDLIAPINLLADPERPFGAEDYFTSSDSDPPRVSRIARVIKLSTVAIGLLLLVLAWRYTPLAASISPENLTESFARIADSPWALPIVLGVFVAAGLVAFPVTLLIAATAAAFGTWQGLLFATMGALASALITYAIGRRLGAQMLRQVMGPRIHRIACRVKDNGIVAMTMVRLMPTPPFTLVNLVAGAARIRISDYMAGTVLGLAPGIVALSALGGQVFDMLHSPSFVDILIFVATLSGWLGVSVWLQRIISRHRKAEA
jgi:Phosphatidylserine/phosphatidylglycerophosphate/cardiolipin synthases and related enzymes